MKIVKTTTYYLNEVKDIDQQVILSLGWMRSMDNSLYWWTQNPQVVKSTKKFFGINKGFST